MIAGAIERNACRQHAMQCISQRGSRRINNCGVKQPRRSRRRRATTLALPGVEADVVVIAAGRNKGRARTHPLHQLETEYAAIKAERTIEIGHLEMNMPDPRSRDDGLYRFCHLGSPCSIRIARNPT